MSAPPVEPPPPTLTAVAADPSPPLRPCCVCGAMFTTEGDGSSWPWTHGQRICVPCLKEVDQ